MGIIAVVSGILPPSPFAYGFGTEHLKIMVMLHGGGVGYLGALPAAEYMARFFHVVLVSYDGFNPTESNTTFRSADYEAEMLANYINGNYGGKIDVLYGKERCFPLHYLRS